MPDRLKVDLQFSDCGVEPFRALGVDYESNKIQFIGNSSSEPLNLWYASHKPKENKNFYSISLTND